MFRWFNFAVFFLACAPRVLPAAGPITIKRSGPDFDQYTNSPSYSQQEWMRDHYTYMKVFTPYFDHKTSWFANSVFYFDLYSIYPTSSILRTHPNWVLKDQNGESLYIPWGCANGSCPQFAADITNADYRAWWINQAQRPMSQGYAGIWIDDVNLQFQVGDRFGHLKAPVDPQTSAQMTAESWRTYITNFVEEIRRAFPSKLIIHNVIWYAAPHRTDDPLVQREILAADFVNLERGVNDGGLKEGSGEWSLNAFFNYVDVVHSLGRSVIFDDYTKISDPAALEYALAAYYLAWNGKDMIVNTDTPDRTWSGYELDLGEVSGPRNNWRSLMRRDFSNGIVLLNPPGGAAITVSLPTPLRTTAGDVVTEVTLEARQGAVLRRLPARPQRLHAVRPGGSTNR